MELALIFRSLIQMEILTRLALGIWWDSIINGRSRDQA